LATHADLEAAVRAVQRAHPGWQPPADVDFALNSPIGPLIPNSVFDSLRSAAPPGCFDSNGQIANPRPGGTPPILPRPNTPNLEPPANIPGAPLGAPVDRNLAHPQNDLADLRRTGNRFKNAKSVPHDPIPSFIDGYNAIIGATGQGPANDGWDTTINEVNNLLKNALTGLGNAIQGNFANGLRDNVNRSFKVLEDMDHHAQTMENLFHAFFNDLSTTKSNFEKYAPAYNQAIEHPDDPKSKETLNQLNEIVLDIMNVYRPPIDDIAASHPSVSSAVPEVGGPMGGPSGLISSPPGGSGGGTPEALTRGGLNTGNPLNPTPPSAGQPEDKGAQSSPNAPTGGQNAGDDSGVDKGQKAGSQAGDGASKAPGDGLKGDGRGGAGLPPGLLGLNTKGGSGSKAGSGSGGRGASGGGGRGAIGVKPPATTATPKLGNSPAPVSRAGVSGAGGQGAAGTPVAGQQGSSADKAHKASKALRLPKNGEEVVGEAEAVVPVIGDAPRKATPATPKKT
jgi:hypothetical protein